MSEYLEAIVRVIAVGVPALLIVLGFFAFVGGSPIKAIGTLVEAIGGKGIGDAGMKSLGLGMIIVGIALYIIEFIVYAYLESQ